MQVELGNPAPTTTENRPAVTYVTVPGTYTYEVADSAADLAVEVLRDILVGDPRVTHMPDQEAVIAVFNSWNGESTGKPSWVWSDNDDFAVLLGHLFGCPVGRPVDVEASHFTYAGPPGVSPPVAPEPEVSE